MAEKKTTKKITLEELIAQKDPQKIIEKLSFEDGISLLEALVDRVESGTLDLDAALNSYEKGTLLVNKLREHLAGAEKKLEILNKN